MEKNNRGFSLIEVLVFVTVLGLFFVAAMTVTTFNLRNMKIQEHKILATRYAEEGNEWLKQEKIDDWSTFSSRGTVAGSSYCLNSLDWTVTGGCGENYSLGTPAFFKRDLFINSSGTPSDQVNTDITVTWKEGTNTFNVEIKSVFKLSE